MMMMMMMMMLMMMMMVVVMVLVRIYMEHGVHSKTIFIDSNK